jgi:enoyl-CoA hydratase
MSVTYEAQPDGVALITMDDGKVNAVGLPLLAAVDDALDRAEAEGRAIVLMGRPRTFSAGFDMATMTGGLEGARELLVAGAHLLMRLYGFPRPVVAACTGHALAAGALLLLACDTRVGARGPFKIGLNEVAIGLRLPWFGIELARDRISKRHLTQVVGQASVKDPDGALAVGFLDSLSAPEDVRGDALAAATALAALPPKAYAGTKERLRGATLRAVLDTLDADMADIGQAFG